MIDPSDKKMAFHLFIDESELRAILLQIPDGILIAEAPSGNLLYQNEEAARLLRHPLLHEGNHEQYNHALLHEDGRPYQPEEYPIARALQGETVRQEELLYRRGDGTLAYLLVSATPIRNDEGKIVKVLCSFVDTTARRRAEQALKESEQRLSLALSGADMAMWHLDVATGDAIAGNQLLTLLGYQPGDIKPSFNLWLSGVHADDKQEALDRWYDHLEGKTPLFQASFRLRTVDGGWKWVQMRGQVIERDAQGKALRAAGTFFDIDRGKRAELALKESEERFCRIFESAAVGIGTITAAGRWLSVNPKLAEILGHPEGELPQDGNIRKIVHADDLARFQEALSALLHNEVSTFSLELRNIRRDGAIIWVDLTVSPVLDPQGEVKYLIVILEDQTARKLAQEQLQNVQAQLRMATQIARLGFWEWDLRKDECYFSDEWKAQLGYSDEELRNYVRDWEERIHPDDRERAVAYRNDFLANPHSHYMQEYRRRHKDGTYRWMSVRAIPLYDENGQLYKLIGTQLDITDQKAAQESLLQSAQHDGLTGLPNRTLLYEFAEHLAAAAHRSDSGLAVLFFDLDRFKTVNDTYGHKVGDGVLKEMARRLDELMRAEDVIGRLGGDEFVAVLPKIRGEENAAIVAMKALNSLGKAYVVGDLELHLSPSIGISLLPQDGKDIDTLIHHADQAMYEAKKEGGNNFRFFTPAANRALPRQSDFALRLHSGLEHRELDLHYQPVIDIGSGQVVGVEALLRWPQMDGDVARPASLIPLAEASGQILPLGDWTLRQACRQHQTWIRHGLPPIVIALNVSPAQFRRVEFQESIQRALAATGMNPAFLEIEVTESMVMKSLARAQGVLHALKKLGLKIALDELGTGYSDLTRLSRLPIDKLKISRALVRHLASDKSRLAIVDAIVALAFSLGIDVVAEGVESEDDLNTLRERHCYRVQGFHLGWPMPGRRFEKWYAQHAAR